MSETSRRGRRIPLNHAQIRLRAEGAQAQAAALLSGVNRSRRRPIDTRALLISNYALRCPLPLTPPEDLPGGGVLLSVEMIFAIKGGLPLPPPDPGFEKLVRGQYRRVRYALRDKDYNDLLNVALQLYRRACLEYDPGRGYSRGPVGFVGGRVVNKLRSYLSPDRRKATYAVESIHQDLDNSPAREARMQDAISDHGEGAASVDEALLLAEIKKLADDAIRAASRNITGRRGLPSMLPDTNDLYEAALSGDSPEAVETLSTVVNDDDFEDYHPDHWSY
jgi:hypothetical protein